MTKFLFRWAIIRWIKAAQRAFGDDDGTFNTACFQSAVREATGVMPRSEAVPFLMEIAGAEVLSGGAHSTWRG